MKNYHQDITRLRTILKELRAKCPWDKKQTIHSLSLQSIEELYELVDAIAEENWKGMKEELGDLLLHILFYSQIAEEQKRFTFEEVVETVSDKLVYRHPHIYEHVKVEDESDVKRNWERLKIKEGKNSILTGVPQALPALVKAFRLQEKTKTVGFEWPDIEQVKAKVEEEWTELEQAKTPKHKEEEMGDLLFAIINYARYMNIDAEQALEKTNKKFIRRFQAIEETANVQGWELEKMGLEEMDKIWNRIKKHESKNQ